MKVYSAICQVASMMLMIRSWHWICLLFQMMWKRKQMYQVFFYGYPQVDQENVLLGMKAFWLAYDKVVRAEIVHSDSLDAFTEQAQDYMSHVYQKLEEESNLLLYYG